MRLLGASVSPDQISDLQTTGGRWVGEEEPRFFLGWELGFWRRGGQSGKIYWAIGAAWVIGAGFLGRGKRSCTLWFWELGGLVQEGWQFIGGDEKKL